MFYDSLLGYEYKFEQTAISHFQMIFSSAEHNTKDCFIQFIILTILSIQQKLMQPKTTNYI